MAKDRSTITYRYRGLMERNRRSRTVQPPGYSQTVAGSVLCPWMTRRECRDDARRRGAVAYFCESC
jgi:hypothetical protein